MEKVYCVVTQEGELVLTGTLSEISRQTKLDMTEERLIGWCRKNDFGLIVENELTLEGRPERDTYITKDEVLNLHISLANANTLEELLEVM